MAAQRVEPRIPESFVSGQPGGCLVDALGRQYAAHDPAFLLARDQAGLFEHPNVLHESDQRHPVRRRQIADTARTVDERLEGAAARRVGERAKHKVQPRILKLNHKVKLRWSDERMQVQEAPSVCRTPTATT